MCLTVVLVLLCIAVLPLLSACPAAKCVILTSINHDKRFQGRKEHQRSEQIVEWNCIYEERLIPF